ncbi:MAG: multiheme c-type cytochrome, partial [Planctomycetota bacterium]
MNFRSRLIILPLLVIGVLIAVAVVVDRFRQNRNSNSAANQVPQQPVSLSRPPARDGSFVGSEACAECHQQIFDQFKASPMGQSMATVANATQVENFEVSVVKPTGHRHYQVTRDTDSMAHHEIMLDARGEPYRDQIEEISFVVGSGQRGRSYLIDRDGLLFQSPIGWYAHGQRWDLSPGYSRENHQRFSRRIGDGCLYCHAGRVNHEGAASDRYEEPVFAELAIGCERCHGPGERHVKIQTDPAVAPGPDTIVNPADLLVSKRESVCTQCHLLGRSVIA